MTRKRKVIACLPAFDEEMTIAKVLVRTFPHVDKVLVVDDGSEDDTGIIAKELGAHVIRHDRNLGKCAGLRDCFDWAKKNDVDILVTLDADGQHNPDEIPRLVRPILNDKADVVIGSRLERPLGMTRRRRLAQKVLDALTSVKEGGVLVDSQSGFRTFSKKAISAVEISEWGLGVESEILSRVKDAGLRIHQVPVRMRYGGAETRRHNPILHFTDVTATIVNVSLGKRPLRVMGVPGLLLLLAGLYGWLRLLETWNATKAFAVGHAFVYTTVIIAGIFMTLGAILLFAMRTMLQHTR